MALRPIICEKCGDSGATYFPLDAEVTCVRCGANMVPDVKQAEHYARFLDTSKPTNPKDAVGIRKPPASCVPEGFSHKGWCETVQVQTKHTDDCENRLEGL